MKQIVLDAPTQAFLSSLRSLRQSTGLSQGGFARLMGLHPSTMQAYESGRASPNVACLMKLADYFGCDLSSSLNYQYYHGKLDSVSLRSRLYAQDLTCSQLAELIGYCANFIHSAVLLRPKLSLRCLGAILDLLRVRERR